MTPFGIRDKDLAELFGSRDVAERVIAAGWLRPAVKAPKQTIYDHADCAKAWTRVKIEGLPEKKARAAK